MRGSYPAGRLLGVPIRVTPAWFVALGVTAALFAFVPHNMQRLGLRIDRRNAGRDSDGLALHDQVLFLIQQCQQFTVLLKLLA